ANNLAGSRSHATGVQGMQATTDSFGNRPLDAWPTEDQHYVGELSRPIADHCPEPLEVEVVRLRQELEERRAALSRQQGETWLQVEKVKDLQQRVAEDSRDALTCFSQLAQVVQLLESGGGRVPLKGEVDRARSLVTAARRSIRRIACGDVEGRAGEGNRSAGNSI
ncbi:unnamed protein product, partial [Polarella glacialis]